MYRSYDYYDYGYQAASGVENAVMIGFMVVYFIILGVALLFTLANYIIQAYAYMKIGKKRGIKNSWLSWIPVADNYVVGSIATGYDAERGIKRNWGKALLISFGVGYGIYFVAYMAAMVIMIVAEIMMETGTISMAVLTALYLFGMLLLVTAVLGVMVWSMLRMICDYKNFEGMVPGKAVKYTILRLCVPLAGPILLLKCAKIIPDVNEITDNVPQIEE